MLHAPPSNLPLFLHPKNTWWKVKIHEASDNEIFSLFKVRTSSEFQISPPLSTLFSNSPKSIFLAWCKRPTFTHKQKQKRPPVLTGQETVLYAKPQEDQERTFPYIPIIITTLRENRQYENKVCFPQQLYIIKTKEGVEEGDNEVMSGWGPSCNIRRLHCAAL